MLCMVCRRWPVGACFASLDAGMGVWVEFVGRTVQLAFPEGRLADVIVVGPVRRPPERRYDSISDSRTINDFIVLLWAEALWVMYPSSTCRLVRAPMAGPKRVAIFGGQKAENRGGGRGGWRDRGGGR